VLTAKTKNSESVDGRGIRLCYYYGRRRAAWQTVIKGCQPFNVSPQFQRGVLHDAS